MSEENGAVETAAEQTTTATTGTETAKTTTATTEATQRPAVAASAPAVKEEPAKFSGFADDWREALAGDDAELLTTLRRFKSPRGVVDKMLNQDKTIRATRPQIKPAADASPEEWAEYRKTVGIPDDPAGYFPEGKLADGRLIGEEDKPIVESFAKVWHEAGLPKAAFDKALDWYYGFQEQSVSDIRARDEQTKSDLHVELRKDEHWGPDFKRNISAIKALFAGDSSRDLDDDQQTLFDTIMGARTADGSLLGNNIAALKFFASIGSELFPAATYIPTNGATGTSVAGRLQEIAQYRRDHRAEYFKNEEMQAEERRLLDIQSRTSSRAA